MLNGAADRAGTPRGGLDIGIRRSRGTVVVRLEGVVDTRTAKRLAAALTDLIAGQGNLAIAVDLGSIRRIATCGLQVLADAAADVERRGGRMSLCEAHEGVLDALRLAGLGRLTSGPDGSGRVEHRPAGRVAPDHPAGSGRQRHSRGGSK
jgi:anti-anti-sigma factor